MKPATDFRTAHSIAASRSPVLRFFQHVDLNSTTVLSPAASPPPRAGGPARRSHTGCPTRRPIGSPAYRWRPGSAAGAVRSEVKKASKSSLRSATGSMSCERTMSSRESGSTCRPMRASFGRCGRCDDDGGRAGQPRERTDRVSGDLPHLAIVGVEQLDPHRPSWPCQTLTCRPPAHPGGLGWWTSTPPSARPSTCSAHHGEQAGSTVGMGRVGRWRTALRGSFGDRLGYVGWEQRGVAWTR